MTGRIKVIIKKTKRPFKAFLVLLLVGSWFFTSWPALPFISFPPQMSEALAATAGPRFAGTGTDAANGADCTWTNPGNATGDTTSTSATCAHASGGTRVSNTLRLTNFGFTSTDIPTGSVINGATVEVEWQGGGTQTVDTTVQLTTDGTSGTGDNKAAGTSQTTKGFRTYGGASDGWNASLTQANVTSSNFGVFLVYTKSGGGAQTTNVYRARITIDYTPPTTTLATGTDPSSATVAPGSAIRDAGAFTLQTNTGSDSVTALTVSLAGSGTPYDGLSEVRITSDNGSTTYFSAISNPSSNTLNFSGGTAIPVTTGSTQFKIRVTPKTHANMAVPPGATHNLNPTVTDWTGTNAKSGSDTNANTLTVDNLSPNGATSTSGSAGDQQVTLNWTTSSSTDFDRSVVLRWAASTPGSEVPVEGATYSVDNTISTATVACVRTGDAASTGVSGTDGAGTGGCSSVALNGGQDYSYKVFQRDTNGNYDTGVTFTGSPFTPTGAAADPTFTLSNYRWYYDNDAVDPTDPWGNPDIAANTAIVAIPASNDPPSATQELRLRVNITVNDENLTASNQQFRLQFRTATDTSCSTGSWTEVGVDANAAWQFATSSVSGGAALAENRLSSDVLQVYAKANPTVANSNSATAGQTIEYDFHIVGSGNNFIPATQYLFRAVEADNTVFDAYDNCPILQTEPDSDNLMRHGNVFVNEGEQGFYWSD